MHLQFTHLHTWDDRPILVRKDTISDGLKKINLPTISKQAPLNTVEVHDHPNKYVANKACFNWKYKLRLANNKVVARHLSWDSSLLRVVKYCWVNLLDYRSIDISV